MQVPTKTIQEIAETLETGLKCFINIETHEIVTLPDEDRFSDIDAEIWQDDIDKVNTNPEKYKEIEGMTSKESYRVMEDFIDSVDDKALKSKLIQAMEGYKPFANFKLQIDRSGPYREKWFAFRKNKITEWVIDQLIAEMS